jgi:S1-C subfamily serine protease
VAVVGVGRGSPAAKIGLEPFRRGSRGEVLAGDLITAVDGEPVADLDDMLAQLEQRRPGERVILSIWREGRSRQQPVELGDGE